MNRCRWNLLPPVPERFLAYDKLPPLLVQLLYNRGLTDPAQYESFLAVDDSLSADPYLLPDMQAAVNRIYRALYSGEGIAVYGDFDADGITATAIIVQALEMLGARAVPYIPHRFTEGYGIKTAALENLARQGISLVITVDCGITALPEAKKASKLGMDMVITDHHTPLAKVPEAAAVVNPRLPGARYPFRELTGAGIAFKLAQALLSGMGQEAGLAKLSDLAAVGTVADVAPLLGENRYLVQHGLQAMRQNPRLGMRELMAQVQLKPESVDAEIISWVLAPRINAAGRMEHAIASYKLLTTQSALEARRLAAWLEEKNALRQDITAQTLALAREQVLAQGIEPIIIAADSEYPVGIAGLVAGRLTEEFYRPTVVIRTGAELCSGSCRSIPEFNIITALNECAELFINYGGHAQAAGFTLPSKNLPRLKAILSDIAASQLGKADLRPQLDIDAEVKLEQLGGSTYQLIQKLAPLGRGNPAPSFLSRVEVVGKRVMGGNGSHLRLKVRQNGTVWDAVGFHLGCDLAEIKSPLHIVYNLELDQWQGQKNLRLNIIDLACPG